MGDCWGSCSCIGISAVLSVPRQPRKTPWFKVSPVSYHWSRGLEWRACRLQAYLFTLRASSIVPSNFLLRIFHIFVLLVVLGTGECGGCVETLLWHSWILPGWSEFSGNSFLDHVTHTNTFAPTQVYSGDTHTQMSISLWCVSIWIWIEDMFNEESVCDSSVVPTFCLQV